MGTKHNGEPMQKYFFLANDFDVSVFVDCVSYLFEEKLLVKSDDIL